VRATREMVHNAGGESLMAVADDGGDAGHGCQFLGRALRIAARDDDAGGRIAAMGAADEGAGRAIGLGGDAAGIDDDDIGSQGLALAEGAQAGGDGLTVCARGAAAEVLDVKVRHLL